MTPGCALGPDAGDPPGVPFHLHTQPPAPQHGPCRRQDAPPGAAGTSPRDELAGTRCCWSVCRACRAKTVNVCHCSDHSHQPQRRKPSREATAENVPETQPRVRTCPPPASALPRLAMRPHSPRRRPSGEAHGHSALPRRPRHRRGCGRPRNFFPARAAGKPVVAVTTAHGGGTCLYSRGRCAESAPPPRAATLTARGACPPTWTSPPARAGRNTTDTDTLSNATRGHTHAYCARTSPTHACTRTPTTHTDAHITHPSHIHGGVSAATFVISDYNRQATFTKWT